MRRSTRSSRSAYQDRLYTTHHDPRPTPDWGWEEEARHTAHHPALYDERYLAQSSAEPFDDLDRDYYQASPRELSFAERVFGYDSTVSNIVSDIGSLFSTLLVVPKTAFNLVSSAFSAMTWGVAYVTGHTFTSVPPEEWASKLKPDDDLHMSRADRRMGTQVYAEPITDASTDYQASMREAWYRQNPDYLSDLPSSMKPKWWQRRGGAPEKSVRFMESE